MRNEINGQLVMLHSAAFSGATLFSILLNQHKDISSDGEMFFPSRKRITKCSCGVLQNKCSYYTQIFQNALNAQGDFNLNQFYYIPKYFGNNYLSRFFEVYWKNELTHKMRNFFLYNLKSLKKINHGFIEMHVKAINTSLDIKGASVYLDGTKYARRTELFAESGYPIRIIHLIRDPRGFCCSFIKNKKLKKNEFTIKKAISDYNKHIEIVDVLVKRTKCDYIRVIYEDLCRDPDSSLSKICEYIGVTYSDDWKKYSAENMHVTGNRMRFLFDGKIVHDEKWKKFFSVNELNLIEKRKKATIQLGKSPA